MGKKLKIFYAWQSDTPARLNHRFIKEAAEDAVRQLNLDGEVEEAERFELDHDTKGVPGTPPVAETICRKIDECSIFIADVTTVGTYPRASDGGTKSVQNANVLIELGYARKAKGVDRLIPVMNTAYGSPEHLPFDLRHLRHPVQYKLSDPAAAKFERKRQELTEAILFRLRAIIDSALAVEDAEMRSTDAAALKEARAAAENARRQFEIQALQGQFHGFDGDKALLTFCLIPLRRQQNQVKLVEHGEALLSDLRPLHAQRWRPENRARSLVVFDPEYAPNGQAGRRTVLVLTADGELFGAAELRSEQAGQPTPAQIVRFHPSEGELLTALCRSIPLVRSEGIRGSLVFGVSLYRTHGQLLVPDHVAYDYLKLRKLDGQIVADPVEIEEGAKLDSPKEMGLAIRGAMNCFWREAGLDADPYIGAELGT